jgi:PKD repeat protein
LLIGILSLVIFNSCKKDDDDDDTTTTSPVASFQFAVDADNFLKVTFTNFSQNATSYSWDFGDGESSTEQNPVHIYAAADSYTVVLTAKNAANTSATFSKTIELEDPNTALAKLAGETSKTWKLFREGTSLGVGPDVAGARSWFALENLGARPCVYYHEFTFARDGSFTFDDMGSFWGETAVFAGTAFNEVCFDAVAENMVNSEGTDVSAWLGGTHAYEYDPVNATITLNGNGAWMGLPQLGTNAESIVPEASKSFSAVITEEVGYDVLYISYTYDGVYWDITYASYSDPSLEPEVVEEEPPYGEDLPDLTPTEMWNTFETASSFVQLDTAGVYPGNGPAANSMTLTIGVADPAGVGVAVGQYDRWGTYQELQFQQAYDIQFDNFTTVSVDVYMPSSNDYSTTLTKDIAIIIGEASQTAQWWTGHTQYDAVANVMDEWVTYTFNLDAPTSAGLYNPKDRTDLDFFAISLGGGGHDAPGTFYIRNFKFE